MVQFEARFWNFNRLGPFKKKSLIYSNAILVFKIFSKMQSGFAVFWHMVSNLDECTTATTATKITMCLLLVHINI